MSEPQSAVELDSPGAFITEMPDLGTARTQSTMTKLSLSPRRLPTKLGIVGEIDVINGLLERMKAKTKRINPESPRTKQALSNLGIVKEECLVKKFSDFQAHTRDEKMQKLLYVYYLGNVNDTISQVLKERDRIRRKKERRSSLEMCAIPQQAFKVAPATATARTHFAHMDFEMKLERLDANKQNDMFYIEKQAMNYLESERDYLKKLEKLNFKQERAEKNKKMRDEKKLKEIEERKLKYAEGLEASQKLFAVKEEQAALRRSSNPQTTKDFKESFQHDKLKRIAEHKQKEIKIQEERKKVEMRIEQREQEATFRSTFTLGNFLRKDMQSQMIMEREQDKKRMTVDKWNYKFARTREHVRSANFVESPELYTRYGEKMRRFQNDMEKIEKERAKKQQERKALKEEQRQKVQENLEIIQRDFNLREELLGEKMMSQTERLEKFYTSRQQFWDQKVDLNRFKNQRSQIHFDKIRANDNRKCNIIMAKNKVSKEACEQKLKEKDILRDACMKNHWNVQAEKESLNYYLDQVNKIHARNDLIAGRLRKVNTTFNVQNMANYISKNFNTAPPQHSENQKEN